MQEYTAVVSCQALRAKEALEQFFDVISLPCDSTIDSPVASHPDMIIFAAGNTIVVPDSYYMDNREVVDDLCSRCGLKLVLSTGERSNRYPHDVALNVLLCGNKAFSLTEHTSGEVKALLEDSNISLTRVKQGYSACSTLALRNAIVTADKSISRVAAEGGIDVLEIESGHIALEGYNEGFVGGASGVCENTVYFLGNIDCHPDSEKIRSFLSSHGFDAVSLWDGPLIDAGGIKFFKNKRQHSDSNI